MSRYLSKLFTTQLRICHIQFHCSTVSKASIPLLNMQKLTSSSWTSLPQYQLSSHVLRKGMNCYQLEWVAESPIYTQSGPEETWLLGLHV